MKKLLSVALAAILAITLVACGMEEKSKTVEEPVIATEQPAQDLTGEEQESVYTQRPSLEEPETEEENNEPTLTLAPRETWYRGNTKASAITDIEFVTELPNEEFTEKWDASSAEDGSITAAISGTKLYISANGAEKIKTNEYASGMFAIFPKVEVIDGADLLDTSGTISMYGLFHYCYALTDINGLSGWNTSAVKDMGSMFSMCFKLGALDLSGWDMSAVKDIESMFHGCESMTVLNISGWNTSTLETLQSAFAHCTCLESIIGIADLNTSNVIDMYGVFYADESLTELDISGWDTTSSLDSRDMFTACESLERVIVGDGTNDEILQQLQKREIAAVPAA